MNNREKNLNKEGKDVKNLPDKPTWYDMMVQSGDIIETTEKGFKSQFSIEREKVLNNLENVTEYQKQKNSTNLSADLKLQHKKIIENESNNIRDLSSDNSLKQIKLEKEKFQKTRTYKNQTRKWMKIGGDYSRFVFQDDNIDVDIDSLENFEKAFKASQNIFNRSEKDEKNLMFFDPLLPKELMIQLYLLNSFNELANLRLRVIFARHEIFGYNYVKKVLKDEYTGDVSISNTEFTPDYVYYNSQLSKLVVVDFSCSSLSTEEVKKDKISKYNLIREEIASHFSKLLEKDIKKEDVIVEVIHSKEFPEYLDNDIEDLMAFFEYFTEMNLEKVDSGFNSLIFKVSEQSYNYKERNKLEGTKLLPITLQAFNSSVETFVNNYEKTRLELLKVYKHKKEESIRLNKTKKKYGMYEKRFEISFHSQDMKTDLNIFKVLKNLNRDKTRMDFLRNLGESAFESKELCAEYRNKIDSLPIPDRKDFRKKVRETIFKGTAYYQDSWGTFKSNNLHVNHNWVTKDSKPPVDAFDLNRNLKHMWPLMMNDQSNSSFYDSLLVNSKRNRFELLDEDIKLLFPDKNIYDKFYDKENGILSNYLFNTRMPSLVRFSAEIFEWVYSFSCKKSSFGNIEVRNTANSNHYVIMSPQAPKKGQHKTRKFMHVWMSFETPPDSDDYKFEKVICDNKEVFVCATKWYELEIETCYDMSKRFQQWLHMMTYLYTTMSSQNIGKKDLTNYFIKEAAFWTMLMSSHKKNINVLASFYKEMIHMSHSEYGFVKSNYLEDKLDFTSTCSDESFIFRTIIKNIKANIDYRRKHVNQPLIFPEGMVTFSGFIIKISELANFANIRALTCKYGINKQSQATKIFKTYSDYNNEYIKLKDLIKDGENAIDTFSYFSPHTVREVCKSFTDSLNSSQKEKIKKLAAQKNILKTPLMDNSNTKVIFSKPGINEKSFQAYFNYVHKSDFDQEKRQYYVHQFISNSLDRDYIEANVDMKVQDSSSRDFYITSGEDRELLRASDNIVKEIAEYVDNEFIHLRGDTKPMKIYNILEKCNQKFPLSEKTFVTWDSKKWSMTFNLDMFICFIQNLKDLFFEDEYWVVLFTLQRLKNKRFYTKYSSKDFNEELFEKQNKIKLGDKNVMITDDDLESNFELGFMQGQLNVLSSLIFALSLKFLEKKSLILASGVSSDDALMVLNKPTSLTDFEQITSFLRDMGIKMSKEKTKMGPILEYLSMYIKDMAYFPSYLKILAGMYAKFMSGNYHLDYLEAIGRINSAIMKGVPYIHSIIALHNFRNKLSLEHGISKVDMASDIPSNFFGFPLCRLEFIKIFGSFAQYFSNIENKNFRKFTILALPGSAINNKKDVHGLNDSLFYFKTKKSVLDQFTVLNRYQISYKQSKQVLNEHPELFLVKQYLPQDNFLYHTLKLSQGTFYKGLMPTDLSLYVKNKFVKDIFLEDEDELIRLQTDRFISMRYDIIKNSKEENKSSIYNHFKYRFKNCNSVTDYLNDIFYVNSKDLEHERILRPNYYREKGLKLFNVRNSIDSIFCAILSPEKLKFHKIRDIYNFPEDVSAIKVAVHELMNNKLTYFAALSIVKENLSYETMSNSSVVLTTSEDTEPIKQTITDVCNNFASGFKYEKLQQSDNMRLDNLYSQQQLYFVNNKIDSLNAFIKFYLTNHENLSLIEKASRFQCANGASFRDFLQPNKILFSNLNLSTKISLYIISYTLKICKSIPIQIMYLSEDKIYIRHSKAIAIVTKLMHKGELRLSVDMNVSSNELLDLCISYVTRDFTNENNRLDHYEKYLLRKTNGFQIINDTTVTGHYDINLKKDRFFANSSKENVSYPHYDGLYYKVVKGKNIEIKCLFKVSPKKFDLNRVSPALLQLMDKKDLYGESTENIKRLWDVKNIYAQIGDAKTMMLNNFNRIIIRNSNFDSNQVDVEEFAKFSKIILKATQPYAKKSVYMKEIMGLANLAFDTSGVEGCKLNLIKGIELVYQIINYWESEGFKSFIGVDDISISEKMFKKGEQFLESLAQGFKNLEPMRTHEWVIFEDEDIVFTDIPQFTIEGEAFYYVFKEDGTYYKDSSKKEEITDSVLMTKGHSEVQQIAEMSNLFWDEKEKVFKGEEELLEI